MTIETIRDALPDYARDIRLNLGSVLVPGGAPGLDERQIFAVAVASALAARDGGLAAALEAEAGARLDSEYRRAARAAAVIMGMNNVYYRFTHLVEDPEYRTLPARLRMSVIGNPGIPRADFELLCLAVSAVNGCGACMEAHERQVREAGFTREAVQSAVRIAAVINATAVARAAESAREEAERHAA
ncbi:MAG TPA: carboxymuconolactone decarboxylase family protein [Gammaproteobacteria bacterium]|nr:carboxymuconolactone decarboxylase family protein [Gammaproteobacteria bacterium]